MTETPSFGDALTEAMPNLRAFAHSLCGDGQLSNDLVQETLLKAWAHKDSFVPGSNLKAWLFTILRNIFYSQVKRGHRTRAISIGDADLEGMSIAAPQAWTPASHTVCDAMAQLPPEQRDVLMLIGGYGYSYEETAEACGCKMGTVKSRLNRSRARLTELLDVSTSAELA